ncbi:hypothetical protein [Pseudoflavonifractor sp. MSJ-37]|uniref:hypothetical protein n=1 Tax=Pseudoflavonifractor sp. MSJ-37 TaxID=2841531 RepID=UPI001C11CAFD|nr:hypothetical protein [Pseudoflavonifractor sp. MSJ-37]MBU5434225.1 hypothetical protein [Pseudoflavonifractor sp. MSJ-37]
MCSCSNNCGRRNCCCLCRWYRCGQCRCPGFARACGRSFEGDDDRRIIYVVETDRRSSGSSRGDGPSLPSFLRGDGPWDPEWEGRRSDRSGSCWR